MKNSRKNLKVLIICHLVLLKVFFVLSQIQSHIVGGTLTHITQVPYVVQLLDNNTFFCGGTLISGHIVVTAAHCVYDKEPECLTVLAGSTFIEQADVRSNVIKIILPKGYTSSIAGRDVAVLELSTGLSGRGIRPITLCDKGWKTNATVRIYGWGKIYENSEYYPKQLRSVTVKAIKKDKCLHMYRHVMRLKYSMFCASVLGQKDACIGDSGGPAVINGRFCGIVSAGKGCANPDYPGVYTNVLVMRKFIKNAAKKIRHSKSESI